MLLSSAGAGGTLVEGNYIGTNVAGTAALANGGGGISVLISSPNNTIGGTGAGAGNLISGNIGDGIWLESSGNRVQGNLIGTDAAGARPLGNTDGVHVTGGNNTIGGTTPGARNLLSGNAESGVYVSAGNGDLIQGNFIGTDITGTATVGTQQFGLTLAGGVTLGGTVTGAGNVISGNSADGVELTGVNGTSVGLIVQGNYIGTDVTGTRALGNARNGVYIAASTSDVIGGTSPGARNIISGNGNSGVLIDNDYNLVEGNYVGTDVTGTVALGNHSHGVAIGFGIDNAVGGTAVEARNVIAGNQGDGVQIISANTTGNVVEGNFIGTDATGSRGLGNGSNGVEINLSTNNTVGGTAPGAGNLLSGNTGYGVALAGAGNRVEGNLIGTDFTGTLALGNGSFGTGGVFLGAWNNTVGGTSAGARNVISGNSFYGILVNTSSGNLMQGNFIGTDITGTQPLGNGGIGVFLGAVGENTIGGATPGAGNVISANQLDGIGITGNANVVQGNFIGTDVTGRASLGNGQRGVYLDRAALNTIGGTAPGAGNLISGNASDGLQLRGSGNNLIQGNRIGTDSAGTGALPNGGSGIVLFNAIFQASGNTIGGTTAGAANVIAFDAVDGVRISGGTGNAIRRNAIFGHDTGLGIELVNGGNNGQAYPELTSAVSDATSTTVEGTLTSTPSTTFTVEFFADTVCNPSGYGEGERFLGATTVTTDAAGQGAFTFTVAIPVDPGQFVAATATDPAGNTSQFSACAEVSAAAAPIALAAVPPARASAGLVGPDASVSTFATDHAIAVNSEPARSPGGPGSAGAPSAPEPRSVSAASTLADSAVGPGDADLFFQSFSLDW